MTRRSLLGAILGASGLSATQLRRGGTACFPSCSASSGGSGGGGAAGTVRTNLSAEYVLLGGSGTSVPDTSGNGLNGTAANINWSASGAAFNGSSSSITLPSGSIVSTSTIAFACEFWAKIAAFSTSDYLFSFGDVDQDFEYNSGGSPSFEGSYGGGSGDTSPGTGPGATSLNTWYQLVISISSGNEIAYLNGTLISANGSGVGTNHMTFTNDALQNFRGIGFDSNGHFLNGTIGEVRFYASSSGTDVLPQASVTQNFSARRSTYGI